MFSVAQILAAKTPGVRTVEASMTVYSAVTLLATYQIGGAGRGGTGPTGGDIFRARLRTKGIIRGRRGHKTLVSELMTSPLFTVSPDQSIEECMQLMTERRIRHLPVIDEEDELVGHGDHR